MCSLEPEPAAGCSSLEIINHCIYFHLEVLNRSNSCIVCANWNDCREIKKHCLVVGRSCSKPCLRIIEEFFHTGSLMSPVGEDLHSHPDDESSPGPLQEYDEAKSAEPRSETQSKTDEPMNSYDTTTCECQCCSNISTPHHPLAVDSSKQKHLNASKCHGK